jgi:hypothetical protein
MIAVVVVDAVMTTLREVRSVTVAIDIVQEDVRCCVLPESPAANGLATNEAQSTAHNAARHNALGQQNTLCNGT